jgi:hypothetical protein
MVVLSSFKKNLTGNKYFLVVGVGHPKVGCLLQWCMPRAISISGRGEEYLLLSLVLLLML